MFKILLTAFLIGLGMFIFLQLNIFLAFKK